jgi:hypothetical protein
VCQKYGVNVIGACVVLADLCDIYIFIDTLLLLLLFVVFTRIRKIFPTCTYFLDPSHDDSIEMERSERERENAVQQRFFVLHI